MTLIEYRDFCREICQPQCDNAPYLALGLAGETGEVIEIVKKSIRAGQPVDQTEIGYELGDVLFYLTRLADKHGLTLAHLISMNVEKLRYREASGTLINHE